MAKATGTRWAAQSSTACGAVLVVAFVLILVLPLLSSGCSGEEATTTTAEVGTTTTEAPETSTTSSTEEIVTTTASSFPPTITHQQDQSRFVYGGTWRTLSANAASGKSLAVGNSSACKLTVRFYGEGISWVAKTSPSYGKASVTLDGGDEVTVDLYSKKTGWKKKVWKSGALQLGDHTVTISWTGKKHEDADATNINIDAIVVAGVLTGTYEQDDTKFDYDGTWQTKKSSAASGGDYTHADESGASLTIRFTGVRLVWLGRIGTGYGQAKVSVDGGPDATVDLYNDTAKAKQTIWDSGVLPMETHTIKIEWLGTKSGNGTGTAINVDSIEVTGSLK